MASTTPRRFTDEFKRKAVALWETSGRMQTNVSAELGITPTMLLSVVRPSHQMRFVSHGK
ncbi:MAG: transposase [Oxalobacteraceae bacterium]|nr:MAG: transposase [Oxalobacteraceae bacterium]